MICMISNTTYKIYNSMYFSEMCQGQMCTGCSGTVKIYTHTCILKYTICAPLQSKALFSL